MDHSENAKKKVEELTKRKLMMRNIYSDIWNHLISVSVGSDVERNLFRDRNNKWRQEGGRSFNNTVDAENYFRCGIYEINSDTWNEN